RDCGPQRRDVATALAALEAVDARPFADVVAVGGAAIEQVLLEPPHEGCRDRVLLLAVRMGRREADVEAGLCKKPLPDADDHRQVEHLIVVGDFHDRAFTRWHAVSSRISEPGGSDPAALT